MVGVSNTGKIDLVENMTAPIVDIVNPKILNDLISNDYLPVVCPVGYDDNYDTYNINVFFCGIIRLPIGADAPPRGPA